MRDIIPLMPRSRHQRESNSYRCMKLRCLSESHSSYSNYGGRGIVICDRWLFGDGVLSGFQCFLADLGPRPEGFTLDRLDCNGPYCPENCCWASATTQTANRRPKSEWNARTPKPRASGSIARRRGASGYRGVHRRETATGLKWRVCLKRNGQIISGGTFATSLEAALAADDLAHSIRGMDWLFNFPERLKSIVTN